MDDLWKAYKDQLEWMAGTAVHLNNVYGKIHQEYLPTPLLSCFFEGPMENGKDLIFGGATYNSSGVTHIGFADVCDSFNAIEDICFNGNSEFHLNLKQLVDIVDNNFAGQDKLLAYLRRGAPKYGTNHPVAVKNAKKLIDLHHTVFNEKENYRGGNYRVAYWTMTNHAGYGKVAKALPNGRKEKVVFASGITPVSQVETELTTALNSVAGLRSESIPGSYALNMKYTPMAVTPETVEKFGGIIQGYFNNGGQQVQFNIQDYETLREAKSYPDQYPHLLVRVSGYSAYFKSLNEAMKDELIIRSQYNQSTGKLVELTPVPKSFSDPE
jgi:formate C-acetyltransferase